MIFCLKYLNVKFFVLGKIIMYNDWRCIEKYVYDEIDIGRSIYVYWI